MGTHNNTPTTHTPLKETKHQLQAQMKIMASCDSIVVTLARF